MKNLKLYIFLDVIMSLVGLLKLYAENNQTPPKAYLIYFVFLMIGLPITVALGLGLLLFLTFIKNRVADIFDYYKRR